MGTHPDVVDYKISEGVLQVTETSPEKQIVDAAQAIIKKGDELYENYVIS